MSKVTFRRIGGRIVPIRGGNQKPPVRTNKLLQGAALAASAAGGALSALTLFSSGRKFAVGQATSFGLDLGASALNLAAHKGDTVKNRAKVAVKGEIANQVVGWGTFGAVLAFNPTARKAGLAFASKWGSRVANYARRSKPMTHLIGAAI